MSTYLRLAAAAVLTAVAAIGCSTGASPTHVPTSAPSGGAVGPSAPPVIEGIAHPTGPTDVVLRFDEAGGFVPVEFLAAHVPYFTLYGDGTVVFVQTAAQVDPGDDGISRGLPVRTGKLTEAQVQDLLEFAIRDGGLAIAKAEYQNPLVADAPTAVFEVNADGTRKTVSVVALGMEDQQAGPDSAIKASLAGLGERLRDFDRGGTLTSDAYTPAFYRAVLMDASGGGAGAVRPWPWPGVSLDEFTFPPDPSALQQGTRVMSAAEVAALGVDGLQNGVQSGLTVTGPDGKPYTVVLRPLLPDERA
jgi:hypothetical protein